MERWSVGVMATGMFRERAKGGQSSPFDAQAMRLTGGDGPGVFRATPLDCNNSTNL